MPLVQTSVSEYVISLNQSSQNIFPISTERYFELLLCSAKVHGNLQTDERFWDNLLSHHKEQAQQPCIRSLQLWHHQDFEELCQMISQGTSENLQCWCCPEFYRLAQIMSVKEWIRGLNTGVWCKATHLSSASPPEYLPQVLFSICQHSANVLDNPGH